MAANEPIVLNRAQLVLAEKRTYLATMRTGIAILVLPMSVVSFLIAFSQRMHSLDLAGLLIPLLAICAGLAGLGIYLVVRSVMRLHHADKELKQIKQSSPDLAELID